jgi:hypothetical protein
MGHSRQFAPQQIAPLFEDFVGAGEQHWGTARRNNCGAFRLMINSNLEKPEAIEEISVPAVGQYCVQWAPRPGPLS